MDQIHTRLTVEQVEVLLEEYRWGLLNRSAMDEVLGISRSLFFALLNEHHGDPERFPITYPRESWPRFQLAWRRRLRESCEPSAMRVRLNIAHTNRRPGLRVCPVKLSTGPATIAVDLPPAR